MRIAVYGVSAAGKDHLIGNLVEYLGRHGVELTHVPGSVTLDSLSRLEYDRPFSTLDEVDKAKLRARFADDLMLKERESGNVVVDGHFSFYASDGSLTDVFTDSDLAAYDVFFYLDTDPALVAERLLDQGRPMSESILCKWQDHEVEALTERLLSVGKELHVVRDDGEATLAYIYEVMKGGWDSASIAREAVDRLSCAETPGVVCLLDCDRTIIEEDSTALLLERHGIDAGGLVDIYRRDRYTNYQCYMAARWMHENLSIDENDLEWLVNAVTPNEGLLSGISGRESVSVVAITAGLEEAWSRLIDRICPDAENLQTGGAMSKYVKYFVTLELQKRGHFVIAAGDSLLDSLMLAHADRSYIYAGKGHRDSIGQMLKHHPYIRQLSSCCYQYAEVPSDSAVCLVDCLDQNDSSIAADIATCKSASGSVGRILRDAHRRLGQQLGRRMIECLSGEEPVVVAMMRSGLPLAEGIADELDCPMLFYAGDAGSLVDQISEDGFDDRWIVLVDGVINTGASIAGLAASLSCYKIAVAAGVVSSSAQITIDVPVFSTRVSDNSYVGSKQWVISDGRGPDTADRLFRTM